MKVALLLPGYLDSPDYLHLITFDKRLKELGYVVERLDLGNLWATGDASDYTVTHFIREIRTKVNFYQGQSVSEIVVIGHSRGAFTAIIAGSRIKGIDKIVALCPPPDIKASVKKWINKGNRVSKRDLPDNSDENREFSIPHRYVEDSLT
ncbi:MAG: alpha/beta hydrolase, partial [Janthinobacterium sp.]